MGRPKHIYETWSSLASPREETYYWRHCILNHGGSGYGMPRYSARLLAGEISLQNIRFAKLSDTFDSRLEQLLQCPFDRPLA